MPIARWDSDTPAESPSIKDGRLQLWTLETGPKDAPRVVTKPAAQAPAPTKKKKKNLLDKAGDLAVSVGKGIAQPFVDTGKQLAEGAKDIIDPKKTPGVNADSIMKLQAGAQDALKKGKISQQTVDMLGKTNNVQARLEAYRKINDPKTTDKDIQAYIKTVQQTEKKQNIKAVGDAAQIASMGLVGTEAKLLLQGGKQAAKTIAKGAVAGAVGGEGAVISNNPNATAKEQAKGAGLGAAAGVVIPTVAGVVGKGLKKTASSVSRNTTKTVNPVNFRDEVKPLPFGDSAPAPGTKEPTIAELGGSRPSNDLQKQLEEAWNTGKIDDAQKIIDKMPADLKAPMQSIQDSRVKSSAAAVGKTPMATLEQAIENPNANIKQAKPPKGQKNAKFVSTVANSPKTAPEVAQKVNQTYEPITNKDTLAQADETIAKDFEGAVNHAKTSTDYSTHTQAQSVRLIDELQKAGRFDDAIDVVEATARRATKGGQSIQILSAYNRLSPEGILTAAQRGIDKAKKSNPGKYGSLKLTEDQAKSLRSKAEKLQGMEPGEPKMQATRELIDELQQVAPTPFVQKLTTLWKAGLLTGVKGAVGGNFIGNSANQILQKLSDVPAAGIDRAIAAATGQRSKTFTLKGLLSGTKEGAKVGYNNFKKGVGAESEVNKLDYKKTYFSHSPLGRAAQKYTDSVFNFYSAADRPFFHAALKNTLNDLALVEAKNSGLRGGAARAAAKKLVNAPPDKLIKEAVQAAEKSVFQNQTALGSGLQGLKQGLNNKGSVPGAVGEVVLPFTGVPSSIASAVHDYSPTGAVVSVYKALRTAAAGEFDQAAQRRLSTALGKSITGTGLLYLGAALTESGQMTLGFPSDKEEQQRWADDGKQPYSILIGGKWRSLNYLGPVSALMAIGGEYNNARQSGSGQAGSGVAAATGAAKAVVGSSPLQGVQSGIDAITDPERQGKNYVNNLAGSVIPTAVKDVANATDNIQRKPTNPLEAVEARVPGLRKNVPAKEDGAGNPLKRTTSAAEAILDPFKSSQAKNSPQKNVAVDKFFRAYKTSNVEQTKFNTEIRTLLSQNRGNEAKRRVQEYNAKVDKKFQAFRDQYKDTPLYDSAWDDKIDSLKHSTKLYYVNPSTGKRKYFK